MAQAVEPSRHGGPLAWAGWVVAWVLGPVATWAMDIAQALDANVPARGLFGTFEAAWGGLLSAAGVYLVVYLGVRSLLEAPRLVLEQLRGATVRIPAAWVGLLSLLVILWLDL